MSNNRDLIDITQEEAAILAATLRRVRNKTEPVVMDIHHPEQSKGWPRYEHKEFPRMMYHPAKLDPQIENQRRAIRHRNEQNPNLPALDLPAAQPLTKVVKDKEELEAARKEGFVVKPLGGQMAIYDEAEQPAQQRDPLAELAATVPGAETKKRS